MTAMYFVVATPLMFAVCTVPGSMILVTLLVLALLVCSAVDRIRRKTWHRRAEALAFARRADEQHAATLRGELYGTYGRYMPAREFLPASESLAAVSAAALCNNRSGRHAVGGSVAERAGTTRWSSCEAPAPNRDTAGRR